MCNQNGENSASVNPIHPPVGAPVLYNQVSMSQGEMEARAASGEFGPRDSGAKEYTRLDWLRIYRRSMIELLNVGGLAGEELFHIARHIRETEDEITVLEEAAEKEQYQQAERKTIEALVQVELANRESANMSAVTAATWGEWRRMAGRLSTRLNRHVDVSADQSGTFSVVIHASNAFSMRDLLLLLLNNL